MVRGNLVILSPRYYIVQNSDEGSEWSPVFFFGIYLKPFLEGLHGVYRQPSRAHTAWNLTVWTVEKGNVFTVNRQKDLTGISNVTISADLHGRLALEESPKTSSHVLKTTLSRSYTDKTLLLAYWIFFRNFIVGFYMTSRKFKLKNYRPYREFTFTMHQSSWKLIFIQIFASKGFLILW